MRLLLDTHTFLWFILGDARVSKQARLAIEDLNNDKLVSIVTSWEIAVKTCTGKLVLAEPIDVLVPREIQQNGFQLLPVDLRHTFQVASLPLHHRDPFDRMLIAQAAVEQLTLVSADPAFDAYPITRLW